MAGPTPRQLDSSLKPSEELGVGARRHRSRAAHSWVKRTAMSAAGVPVAEDTAKTFRILTSAVHTCAQADDVSGAERWMSALQVRLSGTPVRAGSVLDDQPRRATPHRRVVAPKTKHPQPPGMCLRELLRVALSSNRPSCRVLACVGAAVCSSTGPTMRLATSAESEQPRPVPIRNIYCRHSTYPTLAARHRPQNVP